MKIVTWNVNSINARIEHLIKFFKKDQSDIYLIQEHSVTYQCKLLLKTIVEVSF